MRNRKGPTIHRSPTAPRTLSPKPTPADARLLRVPEIRIVVCRVHIGTPFLWQTKTLHPGAIRSLEASGGAAHTRVDHGTALSRRNPGACEEGRIKGTVFGTQWFLLQSFYGCGVEGLRFEEVRGWAGWD